MTWLKWATRDGDAYSKTLGDYTYLCYPSGDGMYELQRAYVGFGRNENAKKWKHGVLTLHDATVNAMRGGAAADWVDYVESSEVKS